MREIQLGNKTVKVRKLTVREVAEFLDDTATHPPTLIEILIDRALPERVVRQVTGLTTDDLNGDVDPDEVDSLWQAVEDENRFLSRMWTKLQTVAKALEQEEPLLPPTSSELPADSQESDTPE